MEATTRTNAMTARQAVRMRSSICCSTRERCSGINSFTKLCDRDLLTSTAVGGSTGSEKTESSESNPSALLNGGEPRCRSWFSLTLGDEAHAAGGAVEWTVEWTRNTMPCSAGCAVGAAAGRSAINDPTAVNCILTIRVTVADRWRSPRCAAFTVNVNVN